MIIVDLLCNAYISMTITVVAFEINLTVSLSLKPMDHRLNCLAKMLLLKY